MHVHIFTDIHKYICTQQAHTFTRTHTHTHTNIVIHAHTHILPKLIVGF